MDASIMRGTDKAAGSVVNVTKLRHPIRAANQILQQGWPVMLNSDAADEFGISNGVEEVSQEWLITELRRNQWEQWKSSKSNPGATDEDDSLLDLIWKEGSQQNFLMKEWVLWGSCCG
ncbi:MAG: hypothetical protein CM15mP2_4420 [Methanobacteriota archaeon]|nr:MAG: hypothetical protein CM15mP2_4420 [Euryarchaeota archaeon]